MIDILQIFLTESFWTAALRIATPLIYAGGVRTADDARVAVNMGADRIALDAMQRLSMWASKVD